MGNSPPLEDSGTVGQGNAGSQHVDKCFPAGSHTLLRSGACGLEGLTGTESPAADGIYITGPVCVGLDTAEDGCKSSSGGSARNKRACNITQSYMNGQGSQDAWEEQQLHTSPAASSPQGMFQGCLF